MKVNENKTSYSPININKIVYNGFCPIILIINSFKNISLLYKTYFQNFRFGKCKNEN